MSLSTSISLSQANQTQRRPRVNADLDKLEEQTFIIPPINALERVTPATRLRLVPADPRAVNRRGSRSSQAPGLKVTLWRAINSCVLLGLGITKAVLAYEGNSAVNTVDMAVGLIWAFISYWCGLIETDCPTVLPWLFQDDISPFLVVPAAHGTYMAVLTALLEASHKYLYPLKGLNKLGFPAFVVISAVTGTLVIIVTIMGVALGLHVAKQIGSDLLKILSEDDWNWRAIMNDMPLWLEFGIILLWGLTYPLATIYKLPHAMPGSSAFVISMVGVAIAVISTLFFYAFVGLSRMGLRLRRTN